MSASATWLSTADRALLQAATAWGTEGDRFWSHFEASWNDRLRAAREANDGPTDPDTARAALRDEHASEARPDLRQVHVSWVVRALREESPAVRGAVVAHLPEAMRREVARALSLSDADLAPDRNPQPEVLGWARALWSERLVGGPTTREDDPQVIVALAQLNMRSLYRLVAAIALAKRAYVLAGWAGPDEEEDQPQKRRELARFRAFQAAWAEPDEEFARVVRADLAAKVEQGHGWPWLGLITIARLLAVSDAHRVRWALQHVPYHVAKFIRSRMNLKNPHISWRSLVRWEARVFQLAWDRLRQEGLLRDEFGGAL